MMKKTVIVFSIFFIICSTLGAQKKVKPRHFDLIPPSQLLPCPDIAVALFQARLESTQLGNPAQEFPMDTIRLLLELESAGNMPVPIGTAMHIVFKRNDEVIRTVDPMDALGAKGSRWAMGVSDTFPHGQKTTYSIQVTSPIQECSVRNNQAAIDIDESRLHPGGAPDLTCSIFMVEKIWRQEGDQFKGICSFSADVNNSGSGYCDNDSQKISLQFIQIPGSRVIAFIPLTDSELPGPGAHKRYSIELPDSRVPFGDYTVYASIMPAHNEDNQSNNLSKNSARLSNTAEMPSIATVRFESFTVVARKLHVTVRMINPQTEPLRNLRLLLLKQNTLVKEWQPLTIDRRSAISASYAEHLPPLDLIFGLDQYKAILTTHNGGGIPPANAILDAKVRNLKWGKMSDKMLENNLQDKENGIGTQTRKKNPNIRIHDDQTRARIAPAGFFISVNGKYIVNNFPDVGFSADIHLMPRLANGKVELDTISTKIHVTSTWLNVLSATLLPGINLIIKNEIEKFASKAMGPQVSDSAEENSGQFGSPIGIILLQGAMDMYY